MEWGNRHFYHYTSENNASVEPLELERPAIGRGNAVEVPDDMGME